MNIPTLFLLRMEVLVNYEWVVVSSQCRKCLLLFCYKLFEFQRINKIDNKMTIIDNFINGICI